MNTMDKAADSAAATPQSQPPLATQLVQAENASQRKESEYSATNSIIADLRKLSASLSVFQRCFTDLQLHIHSFRTSVDSYPHTINNTTPLSASSPPAAALSAPVAEPESEPFEKEEEEGEEEEEEEEEEEVEEEEEEDVKCPSEEVAAKTPPCLELKRLCETMSSRGLKEYMVRHLSNIDRLREQLPNALKLSPNPARLVLDCLDEHVQGSHIVHRKKASLLLLECFLLMMTQEGEEGVVEIEQRLKKEAKKAALAWRKRLISQGGLRTASEIDSRGLLLLVACFKIPNELSNRDIRDLVLNGKGISGVLRRSSVFMEKIPKIIERRVKENVLEAVDLVYTFGVEDRFNPQALLISFLQKSEKTLLNKIKGVAQAINVRAAKKKYSFALKSVSRCLARHKIDSWKLLPDWKIDVKIMGLAKEIDELDKHIGQEELAEVIKNIRDQKMAQKRKIDETESSGSFSNKEMKLSISNPCPPQQQRVVNHVDNNNSTLLEGGGTAGLIYGYSVSPSALHEPVAGSVRENVVGSLTGPVRGIVAMGGAGAGKSVLGCSSAEVYGGTLVDGTPGQIGSHTGQALFDRLASHSYACRPSSHLEGSGSWRLPNTISGDAYWPLPYLEASKGLPNTISGDAYRPSSYLKGSRFTGLPNPISGDAFRSSSYLEGSRSTGLPNAIPGDAYRQPPPYLKVSTGLPNTIPGDAYKPPPYLEGSRGLPNTVPGDAYRPAPPCLSGSTGLPNTISGDVYRPPPYLEASTGFPNTIPCDAYKPPPYLEGSRGLPNTVSGDACRPPPPCLKGSMGLPNTISGDSYRPPPYLKTSMKLANATCGDVYNSPPYLHGSTRLPNTIPSVVAGRSSVSDTYQFADTVPATALYRSSGSPAVDAVPSTVPAHPSSSFYWSR